MGAPAIGRFEAQTALSRRLDELSDSDSPFRPLARAPLRSLAPIQAWAHFTFPSLANNDYFVLKFIGAGTA
jgi:hypothetical protein